VAAAGCRTVSIFLLLQCSLKTQPFSLVVILIQSKSLSFSIEINYFSFITIFFAMMSVTNDIIAVLDYLELRKKVSSILKESLIKNIVRKSENESDFPIVLLSRNHQQL
jgi:hypothetical protein